MTQIYEVVHEIRGYVIDRVSAESPEQAVAKSQSSVSAVMSHAFLKGKSAHLVRVAKTHRKPAKSYVSPDHLWNDVLELRR